METIEKELQSLNGERMMSKAAIQGYQTEVADKLRGLMGEDIKEVLSGNRTVKLSVGQKIRYKVDNFLKALFGDGQ